MKKYREELLLLNFCIVLFAFATISPSKVSEPETKFKSDTLYKSDSINVIEIKQHENNPF